VKTSIEEIKTESFGCDVAEFIRELRNKKLFFFIVKDGNVERIEPACAMKTFGFKKLLWIRGWR